MGEKITLDTICIKCGYRHGQHRGTDAACPIKHGVRFYMENQHFCAHPKEDKMAEKQEYKVIKEFTKYDYIISHQKKYGWTSFKDSCAEFQKDMEEWTYEPTIIPGAYLMTNLSPNFYKHGVMFGFLEKVEPEVFYKLGDKFKEGNGGDCYTLNCWGEYLVGLNSDNGGRLSGIDPLDVETCRQIPASLFHKWTEKSGHTLKKAPK